MNFNQLELAFKDVRNKLGDRRDYNTQDVRNLLSPDYETTEDPHI
jgi:hypothetical protein